MRCIFIFPLPVIYLPSKTNLMTQKTLERKLQICVALKQMEQALGKLLLETMLKAVSVANEPEEVRKKTLGDLKERMEKLQKEFSELEAEMNTITLCEELGLEVSQN